MSKDLEVSQNNEMYVVCIQFQGSKTLYTYKTKERLVQNQVLQVGQRQVQVAKIIKTDANYVNVQTGELSMELKGIHDIELKELVAYDGSSTIQYFQHII